MRAQNQADQQSRVLYDLCTIIYHVLKFPPLPRPDSYSAVPSSSASSSAENRQLWTTLPSSQVSPVAFASLFLGISLTLMLFGSVAFLIGFLLLPWVTILVLAFYFATMLSNLSELGRSILGSTSWHNKLSAWEFL
ncbi:hypothetical protein L6164_009060 [Bauhinia variegata]|uniref:Uncharacterized protein n=1 Tax=Bauhinia variegata TaxID=167791 RepID=A0ACB9PHT5_BAUVA|nr:hypothetical protein L6164_009060 [Bauhinia variegata]